MIFANVLLSMILRKALNILICFPVAVYVYASHRQLQSNGESDVNGSEKYDPSNWYQRYPHYPPYCATPAEMNTRSIPLLSDDLRPGLSRLVHTTVVIRHGARTPYAGNLQCWDGYKSSPEFVWNCNLTTLLATPSAQSIAQDEMIVDATATASANFAVFEKRYDALDDPANNLANELNGTCQTGQLILRGYDQELTNGKFLRDAYIYNSADAHDMRMQLIDTSDTTKLAWDASNLFYRVDDDQRTLMSGQVLIRGIFQDEIDNYVKTYQSLPILPLHVADLSRDTMVPNHHVCHRLDEINERFERTSTFRSFNESHEAVLIRDFQKNVLKVEDMDAIDCLMTTICTDRTLPDVINDYNGEIRTDLGGSVDSSQTSKLQNDSADSNDGNNRKGRHQLQQIDDLNANETESFNGKESNSTAGNEVADESSSSSPYDAATSSPSNNDNDDDATGYGTNLFQRLFDYDVKMWTLIYTDNDSEYAKLSMGPLWAEILPNLQAAAGINPSNSDCCPRRPRSKLALFSGHDTTVMPLMASLGPRVFDGTWAPYATMFLIEIHQVNLDGTKDKQLYRTDFAFRLIYNGQVITSRMDGCPEDADLCDAEILLTRLTPFATQQRNCSRQYPIVQEYSDTISKTKNLLQSNPGGIAVLVLLVLGSAGLSALITYLVLMHRVNRQNRALRRGRQRILQEDQDETSRIEPSLQNGNHHQYEDNSGDMVGEGGTFT